MQRRWWETVCSIWQPYFFAMRPRMCWAKLWFLYCHMNTAIMWYASCNYAVVCLNNVKIIHFRCSFFFLTIICAIGSTLERKGEWMKGETPVTGVYINIYTYIHITKYIISIYIYITRIVYSPCLPSMSALITTKTSAQHLLCMLIEVQDNLDICSSFVPSMTVKLKSILTGNIFSP